MWLHAHSTRSLSYAFLFSLSILLTSPFLTSTDQLPLTGPGWTLELADTNETTFKWTTNASVPGDVYWDLLKSGKIDDPFYEDNDVKYRWIAKNDWIYSKSINLPPEFASRHHLLLRADGIDTIADIYFNDHLIGHGTNMFREYLFQVPTSLVKTDGPQHLKFHFHSPILYSLQKSEEHKKQKNYTIGLECRSELEHGECHANFIRKMQASYGWDWGPAIPTMGIWKFLSLESVDSCYLKRFSVIPAKSDSESWILHTEFFLFCNKMDSDIEFCLKMDELGFGECWKEKISQIEPGQRRIYRKSILPKGTKIDYWWPNGLGGQRLYRVIGLIHSGMDEEKTSRVLDIGFRWIQWIEDPVFLNGTQAGLTFYAKINDVPVFLKGANWIPGDVSPSRINQDRDRLEFYFLSMHEANMNCIRVWGGGVYESDTFYSLADRYGITIWHDMMFAVDLYPSTKDFLDNVRSEIEDQINRLKYHPSIIMWAGNNENELGLVGGWYSPMDAPHETYNSDYMALYNTTIYGVINQSDFHTRPYVLSSPSNGLDTIRQAGVAQNPNDNRYGDVHFYSYGGDSWTWTKYPTPRCATEYGYLSIPYLETLEKVLNESNMEYFSAGMQHRQHHDNGRDMLSEVITQFDFFGCKPEDVYRGGNRSCNMGGKKRLADMEYLSQIHQAMAFKTETEHYRRWRSMMNDRGEGYTMCALYWQLNDIWQAPTWSTIDYGLKWKAAQYEAKRFFAHLIVSPYVDGGKLKVVAVNDLNKDFHNLMLVIKGITWTKLRPLLEFSTTIEKINATSSAVIYESPMSKFEDQSIRILNFVFLDSKTDEELTPNNVMFLQKLSDVSSENFGTVSIDGVKMEGSKVVRINLLASGVAPFVRLDVREIRGFFTDNFFTMITKRRSVRFIAWENIELEKLVATLTVKTLGDVYRSEHKNHQ